MAVGDDMVYFVNSETDYSNWPETSTTNTFFSYNIKTATVNSSSFLKMHLRNWLHQVSI